MKEYVVDSSVAIKWFLEEDYMDEARRLLEPGFELHTLDLMLLECSNVVCKNVRRKKLGADSARNICEVLAEYPFHFECAEDYRPRGLEVSFKTGASIYDAVFLAQAEYRGAPLVTADRRLYNNITESRIHTPILWVGDL